MFARLISNWVYGGCLAGLLLLLLTPVLVHSWPVSLVTTFLCLPVYMVHQYEEHDNDRFQTVPQSEDWETKSRTLTVGCLRH